MGGFVFVYILTLAVLLALHGFLASNASDIAEDKGYEKRKWFHMCFWLSLPAYLIVCAMPNKRLTEAVERLAKQSNQSMQPEKAANTTTDQNKNVYFNDLPNL